MSAHESASDVPVAPVPRVDETPPLETPRTVDAAVIHPFPGVRVEPDAARVELEAIVVLDEGWLEQIACMPGSREHEALLVPTASASQLHAALLLAGAESGQPGGWVDDGETVRFTPPAGAKLRVGVRYMAEDGEIVEVPIGHWIRDHHGRRTFPDAPWIFAGSRFETAPDGSELYVADYSGSLIGLVTFGDEVVGFSEVLADQAAVSPPEWEAAPERIPPVGTAVTLVLQVDGG